MLAFIDPETLIPADHPLWAIKRFADAALLELSPLFDVMYAADGDWRASIPPERLLNASLLISLYSIRSERAFCEELRYHLLLRCPARPRELKRGHKTAKADERRLHARGFLDMDMVKPIFDHSTFSKNRARLLRHASVASSSMRWCCRRIACTC